MIAHILPIRRKCRQKTAQAKQSSLQRKRLAENKICSVYGKPAMKMSRNSVRTSDPVADASSSVCTVTSRVLLPPVVKFWDLGPRIHNTRNNEVSHFDLPLLQGLFCCQF